MKFRCFDGFFGLGAYVEEIEAEDHEEAASAFARMLHQSGEQYPSYVVGVIGADGQRWRCNVEPRMILCFGVTTASGGAPCSA